jgi:hypothetical protein
MRVHFCYKLVKVKVKVKLSPRHEDVWGSGSIATHILKLDTSWRPEVSFTPPPPPIYPRYPLKRRLGELQGQSGRSGEEKKFLFPPGNEPRSCSK